MNTKTPMKIDHILDDVVLLILDEHKPLSKLGIVKSKVYIKIEASIFFSPPGILSLKIGSGNDDL